MRRRTPALLASLALAVSTLSGWAGPARAAEPAAGTIVYTTGWQGSAGSWHYQLWRMDADGSNRRQLTADPYLLPYTGALSPNGRQVAYTQGTGYGTNPWHLQVVNIDGTGTRDVLAKHRNKFSVVRDPSWSPDGRTLLFVGQADGVAHDLWTVNLDGSGLRRVTTCGCAWENKPKWSPTRNEVLWSPNTYDVSILDLDTGQSRRIHDHTPSGALSAIDYTWSPDGNLVAFSGSARDRATTDIYVVGRERTGGLLQVTKDPEVNFSAPHFSPDGSRIAVSAQRSESADAGDIWLVNASGLGEPQVLSGPFREEITSWGTSCSSNCTPGGKASSISLYFETVQHHHVLGGGLMPGRTGAIVKVVLEKQVIQVKKKKRKRVRKKVWKAVRSTSVRTTVLSTYETSVPRVSGALCRLRVSWAGDAQATSASRTSRAFIC